MKSFYDRLEALINSLPEKGRVKARQELEAVIQSGAVSYRDWLALIANPKASPDLRRKACWIISQMGDGRAFSAFGRALEDPDPKIRAEAIGSLVHLRARVKRGAYPKVVDSMLDAFQSDPDLDVRIQAGFGLREFHDPRTLGPLIAVVIARTQPDPVRDVAAEALAYIPDRRVIGTMLDVLTDPAEVVRISAAYTLDSLAGAHAEGSFIGPEIEAELEQTVLPLIQALQDPSEKVRYWVTRALGNLGDARAIPELQRVAETDKGTWYGDEVAEAARYAIQIIQGEQPE